MNSWRPYPLLRLVFPFTAGILAGMISGNGAGHNWLLPVLITFILIAAPVVVRNYRYRWIIGLVVNCFMLMAGYETALLSKPQNDPSFFGNHPDGLFLAAVAEPPAIRNNNIRTMLEVRFYREQGNWVATRGKAMAYLRCRADAGRLSYGDFILLQAGFIGIRDNSNPHAFNYSQYLKNKGVLYQVVANPHEWRWIRLSATGLLYRNAFHIRDRLLNILRHNHLEGREFAVAAALLLGYVDDIDASLRKDYAATGAMHILSVSGMHVGIIYIFLEFLLGFLNRSSPGRWIKMVLLLLFIWSYALLTGMSPSVVRSAAMLSLPVIAKALNRSPDMFNIMAASMFLILAVDPCMLYDVGFQLSWLAVIGIVILYKPIYDLYITTAWLPDKIWSILAVSLAAQIATMPISLYTFHQFPNYFMLTNIFVVPLSSLIIYAGILTLAVGTIPVISAICVKGLGGLIWLLNTIIHRIEQLPFSTTRGIFLSPSEMWLFYLILAALFLFFSTRRRLFLYVVLISMIALNILVLDFRIDRLRSGRLVIYNAGRESLCRFSVQDRAVLLYGQTTIRSGLQQEYNQTMALADLEACGIKFHRDMRFPAPERPPEIAKSFVPVVVIGRFIQFSDARMVVLSAGIPKGMKYRIRLDYVIISGNPKLKMEDILRVFHPGQVIIDGTNSRFRTAEWRKDAARLHIKFHAVAEDGAFVKEI